MAVDGELLTCIGTLHSGTGTVALHGTKISVVTHGATSVFAGSIGGAVDVTSDVEHISSYMEGAHVCFLGNLSGEGSVSVLGGIIHSAVTSGSPQHMMPGTVIHSGNVQLSGDIAPVHALSPMGDPLTPVTIQGIAAFRQLIETAQGSYTYTAYPDEKQQLCVYLPDCFAATRPS